MKISKQYLAGFLDGEGYIGLEKHTDKRLKRKWTVRYRVTLTNQHKGLMEELHKEYGGSLIKKPNQKECWALEICKKSDISKLLKGVMPYLIIKNKKAEELLNFIEPRLDNAKHLSKKQLSLIKDGGF